MLLALALATLTLPTHSVAEHPARDVVATALADGRFGTLAKALETADLVEVLQGDGPFTALAPTDEAFAAVPAATLKALLEPRNRAQLVELLQLHVIPGRVSAADALAAGDARTLAGESLHVRLADGRLRIGDANVIANDVTASNGIVHAVDRALIPEGGLDLAHDGRLVIGVFVERPSLALAAQLRLERNDCLLVTSVTKNGPAQAAGLQAYDVILAIEGEHATSASLADAKARVGRGGTLELSILRGGIPRTLAVEVALEPH